MSTKNKLLLVDGHALLFRAFHAIPGLTNKDGFPTGAIYGFFSIFLRALTTIKPTHVLVTFDMGEPTFRHKMDKDYKANRQAPPDDLLLQQPKVAELLSAMNIPIHKKAGYEADDIIGIITRKTPASMHNIILTGDMDLLQLINKNTTVYRLKTGISDFVVYDKEKMMADYGLTPDQWVDYKALKGDASDNIPGVAGIGEKTAIDLIKRFGSLEKLYKAVEKEDPEIKSGVLAKLQAGKHYAFLSYKLALIDCENYKYDEFELDKTEMKDYDQTQVINLLQELGIKSLIPKLPKTDFVVELEDEKVNPKKNSARGDELYQTVDNPDVLDDMVKALSKTKSVAVDIQTTSYRPTEADLVGISIALSGRHSFYIPADYKEGVEAAKKFLEDEKIQKWGSELKATAIVLKKSGINMAPITFDVTIAAYLNNPGQRSYDIESLAFSEFGVRQYGITSGKGKGKADIDFTKADKVEAYSYGCEDAVLAYRLKPVLEAGLKDRKLEKIFKEIEMPLIPVLMRMEELGVVLDTKFLKDLSIKTGKKIKELEKAIHKMAGYDFNVSSPTQLRDALFTKLQIPTTELKKRGKDGGLSTAATELEKLRGLHPIIDLIFEYRELSKLKSTYLDALPELVSLRDHRLHTNYIQTIAATGRLSSNDPNLQNIPVRTEIGRSIRKGFTAAPGFVLSSIDYSQIELRIAASITGDPEMVKIFKSGKDFHQATAARIFNVMESSVSYDQRRDAKTINFSVLYGVSAFGLSERSDMGRAEAGDFIKRYYQVFAKLKTYIDDTIKKVHDDGYVRNALGRIRYFPEINASNFSIRAGAERAAFNMPIQSLQADIIKMAMIEIQKQVVSDDCRMLLQVHDELVFEIKEGKEQACIKKIKEIMESAYKLKVPIIAEAKVGKNWLEMEKV